MPELRRDADWTRLEVKVPLPEGADYILVKPALMLATGVLDVDDIQMEPIPLPGTPPRALPVRTNLPEGSFEQLDANGKPVGWQIAAGQPVQVGEENGNNFLRLTNDNNQAVVKAEARFRIDPTWKALRIRVRLRGSNLQTGPNPLDTARLAGTFEDASRQAVGRVTPELGLRQDQDWTGLEAKALVPTGAVVVSLQPMLRHTTGTFELDDIVIEEISDPNL